jgi:ankyrin repeat protein
MPGHQNQAPPVTNLHDVVMQFIQDNLPPDSKYKITVDGICNGISRMAQQALLLGDAEWGEFVARINLIIDMHDDSEKNIFKKPEGALTTDEKQTKLDIEAFLNGIFVYQYVYELRNTLFPNAPDTFIKMQDNAFDLVKPTELESPEQQVQKSPFVVNSYFKTEITKYLENLDNIVKDANDPIAIYIYNNDHAISIGYLPKEKKYVFIDANQLEVIDKKYDNIHDLTGCLRNAFKFSVRIFGATDTVVFGTQIKSFNSIENFSDRLNEGILDFNKETSKVKSTIGLSKVKVNYSGKRASDTVPNLLDLAIAAGDVNIVRNFFYVGEKINENRVNKYLHQELMITAVIDGHADVVSMLLNIRENRNNTQKPINNIKLLEICLEKNHQETANILLDSISKQGKQTKKALKKLFVDACGYGHEKVVEKFLQFDANIINFQDVQGYTGLMDAIENDHLEVVETLLNMPGINVELQNENKENVLEMAVRKNNINIVNKILPKSKNDMILEPQFDQIQLIIAKFSLLIPVIPGFLGFIA